MAEISAAALEQSKRRRREETAPVAPPSVLETGRAAPTPALLLPVQFTGVTTAATEDVPADDAGIASAALVAFLATNTRSATKASATDTSRPRAVDRAPAPQQRSSGLLPATRDLSPE